LCAQSLALSLQSSHVERQLVTIDTQGGPLTGFTRPEIDRVGSAWLIRKFIDPEAKFVFGDESAAHPVRHARCRVQVETQG
jgi:hypothetical protein